MKRETISVQMEYTLTEKGAVITKMRGRAAEIRIPESIDGVPVIAIGEKAFAVKEEAPVAEQGEELAAELAFVEKAEEPTAMGQALQRVFLPDSIETIGAYAFSGCSALERIHLPARLTEIPQRMFDGCGALAQVTLPAGLQAIGDYAFYGCGRLERLRLPEGVQRIGKYAFYNCRKIEEINIPLAATDLNTGLFLN